VYDHDNISQFLLHATELCNLPDHLIFASVDLVDAKNDRAVVTCLLAVGRWALDAGRCAPQLATLDREIEQQLQDVKEGDIDAAINAAEDDAASCGEVGSADDDSDDEDGIAVAAADAELTLALSQPSSPVPAAAAAQPPQPRYEMPVRGAREPVSFLPQGSGDRREPVASQPPAPAAGTVTHQSEASPKRYQAKPNDMVDQRVGKAYNKLLARMHRNGQRLHGRIARTGRAGEYVIYHQITKRRTLVHVRELSAVLMIRVGGGWEDFEDYLARRLVDFEVVKPGATLEKDRAARRRANTVRA
jgi:hypothetical protein